MVHCIYYLMNGLSHALAFNCDSLICANRRELVSACYLLRVADYSRGSTDSFIGEFHFISFHAAFVSVGDTVFSTDWSVLRITVHLYLAVEADSFGAGTYVF